ncbi:MAG: TadE family protein [Actinomycetes bacterium]
MKRDNGSVATEFVLLTPLLIIMLMFVVHAGRAGQGMNQLKHAADQGARAASLVSQPHMSSVAQQAVVDDLSTSGLSCMSPRVGTRFVQSSMSSSVTVTVSCQISNEGLSLLGAHTVSMAASSTEVIDRYRAGG